MIGDDVKLRVSFADGDPAPDPGAGTAAVSGIVLITGGEALLAGLGALELAFGLAKPEALEVAAAPLTDALALTNPLMPIPWSRRDIVGGDPAEVPEVEPYEPTPWNCIP